MGFGGPCFPRDNRAVAYFAQTIGVDADLARTTNKVNWYQNRRIVGLVRERIGGLDDKKIAILGLTYKPDTNVVEESAALEIAQALVKEGALVSVYDPAGMENAKRILEVGIKYASSVEDCLADSELCILATPWDEFRSLKPEDFTKSMKKPVLLDCWRILDPSRFTKQVEYIALGRANRAE